MAAGRRTSRKRVQREFSAAVPDPHRGQRWRRRMPLLLAFLAAIPLCWLSIRMSLLAAQFMQPMTQLGVPNGQLVGMWFLAATGWLMTAATIVMLMIGLNRQSVKHRVRWSIIAVAVAALFPLSWLFFYI